MPTGIDFCFFSIACCAVQCSDSLRVLLALNLTNMVHPVVRRPVVHVRMDTAGEPSLASQIMCQPG